MIKQPKYSTKGEHYVIDVWYNENPHCVKCMIKDIMKLCKVNILGNLHHEFEPDGETLIYLLSESHISAHTYPEHKYISFDIYTCGDKVKPEKMLEYLRKGDVKHLQYNHIIRGVKVK